MDAQVAASAQPRGLTAAGVGVWLGVAAENPEIGDLHGILFSPLFSFSCWDSAPVCHHNRRSIVITLSVAHQFTPEPTLNYPFPLRFARIPVWYTRSLLPHTSACSAPSISGSMLFLLFFIPYPCLEESISLLSPCPLGNGSTRFIARLVVIPPFVTYCCPSCLVSLDYTG